MDLITNHDLEYMKRKSKNYSTSTKAVQSLDGTERDRELKILIRAIFSEKFKFREVLQDCFHFLKFQEICCLYALLISNKKIKQLQII